MTRQIIGSSKETVCVNRRLVLTGTKERLVDRVSIGLDEDTGGFRQVDVTDDGRIESQPLACLMRSADEERLRFDIVQEIDNRAVVCFVPTQFGLGRRAGQKMLLARITETFHLRINWM